MTPDADAWETANARRNVLVDKLYSDGGLSKDEEAELHELELEAGRRHQGLIEAEMQAYAQGKVDGHSMGPVDA